jgi:hypothetical protein
VLNTVKDNSEDQARLEAYLEICNKVLEANRDRFPFSRIWEAGEAALKGRTVALAVVDDEPKASCVVRLENKHIEATEEGGECPPVTRLSKQYVEDVLAHPDKYIADPALIDWGWLMGKH